MAKKTKEPSAEDYKLITAPDFYGSTFVLNHTSNQFTLIGLKQRPMQHTSDLTKGAAINEPVAVLTFSPQTAKDLSLLFSGQVKKYEDAYGTIQTEYTRKVAESDRPLKNGKKR